MIGIGVTTRNRPEVLARTLGALRELLPPGAKLVVVDDASEPPVSGADFRFAANVGIAAAKNKCLELLDDCEHIFLFDDDTYPRAAEWWAPYVESPEPHLMYIFEEFTHGAKLNDTAIEYQDDRIVAYAHPRGCMLYVHRSCLEAVGGMDSSFGAWGWEHVDFSDRVYDAGLTTFRYADVPGSKALIYSGDEHRAVASTMSGAARRACIARNEAIYQSRGLGPAWVPYKLTGARDVVLAAYFTGKPDFQRNIEWTPRIEDLEVLTASVTGNGAELVVFHNELEPAPRAGVEYVQVECPLSPYWQRWVAIRAYLRDHPEVRRAWCVDGTDVEMLRNPFPEMGPFVYTGDEPSVLNCEWVRNHNRSEPVKKLIAEYGQEPLLNAGIVGGSRADVLAFVGRMLQMRSENIRDVKAGIDVPITDSDMGMFNLVARRYFNCRIKHGRQVNTVFKAYKAAPGSWWRHK